MKTVKLYPSPQVKIEIFVTEEMEQFSETQEEAMGKGGKT